MRRSFVARATALLVLTSLALLATPAEAQPAPPLEDNNFSVDLTSGVVLASGRIVGLGGAYTALAHGLSGAPFNPAAYASRELWELEWFQWELTAGILFPGAFSDNDFYNTGREDGFRYPSFVFVDLGARLQLGRLGAGIIPSFQIFTVESPSGETVNIQFLTMHTGVAHDFFDGQLVLGAAFRLASLAVQQEGRELVGFSGVGLEFGGLIKLADQPWRLGAAVRTTVESAQLTSDDVVVSQNGVRRAAGFILPTNVRLPWEFTVGLAYQVGPRPLNARWVDPNLWQSEIRNRVHHRQFERERAQRESETGTRTEAEGWHWLAGRAEDAAFTAREIELRAEEEEEIEQLIEAEADRRTEEVAALDRFYLLFTLDLALVGPAENAIGPESFLAQENVRSGESITAAMRFGVEGEPWPTRLKLRLGSYFEPSRATAGYRAHVTGGFDLRLFDWDLFGLFDEFSVRAGMTADIAPRYFDWGISMGIWH